MPLTGEYEPSQNDRTREQVELYEATNGVEGGTFNGKPVIVLTFKGAKSGKLRKTPLMRFEHNGTYAVVASNAGAPTHPFWYYNIVANPLVELQDGAVKQEMRAREVFGQEKDEWRKRADAAYPDFPPTEPAQAESMASELAHGPTRLRRGETSTLQHRYRSSP
jgi:F420H(2)-dependent quinone reductase